MNRQQSLLTARGLTDRDDRLLTADEPLAELHENCGGSFPGTLAVPELLDLVREGRQLGLRIARSFEAFDGQEVVSGYAKINPLDAEDGGGCELLIENWHSAPPTAETGNETVSRIDAIDRAVAEITGRLDARQCVRYLTSTAPDGAEIERAVAADPGKVWSDYLDLTGLVHRQPLHWRILDGTACRIPGSTRSWRARLIPIGPQGAAPRGFELVLVADEPAADPVASIDQEMLETAHSRLVGSALTPVLRQPIARIIANAETIRARLAGPLRPEYSEYAGSIAAAGQHLSGMLDDLADLEVVEAPGFSTAKDRVDLCDAIRRAAGILGVRAQSRSITIDLIDPDEKIMAQGEFRRVLQILINLIGNAIAYSPEGSAVTLNVAPSGADMVEARIKDEGPGVDSEQAARIFDKFERLGRDADGGNDTGSGLGLYISRKLALAMGGNLEVVQHEGEAEGGAEFRLTLPAVS